MDDTAGPGDGYDFRMVTGSPLVDAGSNAEATAIDIFGVARPQGLAADIGCMEFSTPVPLQSPIIIWLE